MYKELKDIFNYLVTVRVLKTYLSIDVEFPIGWKIPKKFVQEDKIMENEKMNKDKRFFSFVSEFDEEALNTILKSIKSAVIELTSSSFFNEVLNSIDFSRF